jgi:ATP-dependent Clp protease ATP-binding subunit ClpC
MFERFTDGARQAVVLAQDEARQLNHPYIGTEHILLGLLREQQGIAANALADLGISLDEVRRQVVQTIGRGAQTPGPHLPFTPPAKNAIERSFEEASTLRHDHVGTEHILLGLLHESGDTALQLLVALGIDASVVRQQVLESLR